MNTVAAIIAAIVALVVAVGGYFGQRKWKNRAKDSLVWAENAKLASLSVAVLKEKEQILESLDRARGLSDDDRLSLALIRAAIRRSESGAS